MKSMDFTLGVKKKVKSVNPTNNHDHHKPHRNDHFKISDILSCDWDQMAILMIKKKKKKKLHFFGVYDGHGGW